MSTDQGNNVHLQEINQEIYKQNLELEVANKTLSLLRKLYQISLLALNPASLSELVSQTVRVDLNMEAVGVFLYDQKNDALNPFKFSKSDRLVAAITASNAPFDTLKIEHAAQKPLLRKVLVDKTPVTTNKIVDIWDSLIDPSKLQTIASQSHLQTSLLYPLQTQEKVIGMLLLALNRDYELLSTFEKD